MQAVINNLYVGGDTDYSKLSARSGWSYLRCCKEGLDGHRSTLGYATQGAPKGPQYLATSDPKRPDFMALNFIDPDDPNFIPKEMVLKGIGFIERRLEAGDKVLVACNQGHSRGPSTVLLYLRHVGELTGNFIQSERIFRTLCPGFEPGVGMRAFTRSHWNDFEKETH